MELDSFTQKLIERTQARRENINKKLSPSGKRSRDPPLSEKTPNEALEREDSLKRKCEENDISPKRQSIEAPKRLEKENLDIQLAPDLPVAFETRGLAALRKKKNDCPSTASLPSACSQPDLTEEAQGFVKSPSTSKLTYAYQPSNPACALRKRLELFEQQAINQGTAKSNVPAKVNKPVPNPSNKPAEETQTAPIKHVSQLIIPVGSTTTVPKPTNKDPSVLPVAAKRAMFESPTQPITETAPELLSVAQRANLFMKAMNATPVKSKAPLRKENSSNSKFQTAIAILEAPSAETIPPCPPMPSASSIMKPKEDNEGQKKVVHFKTSPIKNVAFHTRQLQQKLLEEVQSNGKTENKAFDKAIEERKQEIENLKNRFQRRGPEETLDEDSDSEIDGEEAKINEKDFNKATEERKHEIESLKNRFQPKETLEDFDEAETKVKTVWKTTNQMQDTYIVLEESAEQDYYQEPESFSSEGTPQISFTSEAVNVCNKMDEMLDEAMEEDNSEEEQDQMPSPNKLYPVLPKLDSLKTASSSVYSSPRKSSYGLRDPKESDVPLAHSVSFYRRQKQMSLTPVEVVRKVEIRPRDPSPNDQEETRQLVEDLQLKIRQLQEDLHRQDVQVKQTCQALFLCAAKPEFFGSSEHVEGERLLLLTSLKRSTLRNCIEQLKTEAALGSSRIVGDRGTLSLSEIRLPLKQEFLSAHSAGMLSDTVHYFFCLIRYGEKVIATEMLSTRDGITAGTLSFSNHICLQELKSNFTVLIEVYALQTQQESLPHDRKYHIKKDSRRAKKYDSKARLTPTMSSPAPTVQERSSNFDVVGSYRLTLDNCRRRVLSLEKVPLQSPLDGRLLMKLQLCTEQPVKEKGFLTMFEDVSGFGAWHRRWCVLSGNYLSFWKYPDHQKTEVPIGSIDLRQCVTAEVGLVATDICARKHTFMLLNVRPQSQGDKTTLVSQSHNTYTTTKHLLSADTKEERILWCTRLNKALDLIRKWDPEALRPMVVNESCA